MKNSRRSKVNLWIFRICAKITIFIHGLIFSQQNNKKVKIFSKSPKLYILLCCHFLLPHTHCGTRWCQHFKASILKFTRNKKSKEIRFEREKMEEIQLYSFLCLCMTLLCGIKNVKHLKLRKIHQMKCPIMRNTHWSPWNNLIMMVILLVHICGSPLLQIHPYNVCIGILTIN